MNSINSILHSEFYISIGYLDRLIFATTELSEFHYTPNGRNLFNSIFNTYQNFFSKELQFELNSESNDFKMSNFSKDIKSYQQYVEKFISLPFINDQKIDFIVNFININYKCAHELHNFVLQYTSFDIQYPRMAVATEINNNSETEELTNSKFFYIKSSDVYEIQNELDQNKTINFLDLKREEKYDHFIRKGHFYITDKNYEKALENFYKAKNYKDTAEVFTLLAWCYSFQNNLEKAKNYCLKAIAKDPQYGPAYNDFGNYLLSEGNVKESFKWFELAKKALNYQNREYPYINSGRAYMMLNKYEEAVKEFSYALVLAPYHEELHSTVQKLQLNLERTPKYGTKEVFYNETI
jgi:Tfp pilus assembly protein PilF